MKKNERQDNITHAGKVNERTKALEVLEKAKKVQGKLHFSVRESEETLNRKMKSKDIAKFQFQLQ